MLLAAGLGVIAGRATNRPRAPQRTTTTPA
jgi:hypothetical protein